MKVDHRRNLFCYFVHKIFKEKLTFVLLSEQIWEYTITGLDRWTGLVDWRFAGNIYIYVAIINLCPGSIICCCAFLCFSCVFVFFVLCFSFCVCVFFESAFFDVRIFNPTAQSCRNQSLPACYRRHELEKRRHYEDRVIRIVSPP